MAFDQTVHRDAALVAASEVRLGARGRDHRLQVRRLPPAMRVRRELASRQHQRSGAAVVENVRELVGLRGRVDHQEDGARLENREEGHDRFGRVVQMQRWKSEVCSKVAHRTS